MRHDRLQVLVAGGAGFIGTNLCSRLLQAGYNVTCLDNLASGNEKNVALFSGNRNYTFVEQDVCSFKKGQFDLIFNLACCASPNQYQADPLQTLRTNTEGVTNLLNISRRQHGAVVFQASTSEIYGEPQEHPQCESYFGNVNPLGPRACYDEGKRCAETTCMEFHRAHAVDVKIARIFNTYGPYMRPDDGRVVSNFIVQALLNQPITIYGNGLQTRSFCFVDDLVDGILALVKTPQWFTGPVNLGNPCEFTVLDLAKLVIEMTNSRSDIVYRSLPLDDPTRRRPSIDLACEVLQWKPKVSLEEGLQKTILYFETYLQAPELSPGVNSSLNGSIGKEAVI